MTITKPYTENVDVKVERFFIKDEETAASHNFHYEEEVEEERQNYDSERKVTHQESVQVYVENTFSDDREKASLGNVYRPDNEEKDPVTDDSHSEVVSQRNDDLGIERIMSEDEREVAHQLNKDVETKRHLSEEEREIIHESNNDIEVERRIFKEEREAIDHEVEEYKETKKELERAVSYLHRKDDLDEKFSLSTDEDCSHYQKAPIHLKREEIVDNSVTEAIQHSLKKKMIICDDSQKKAHTENKTWNTVIDDLFFIDYVDRALGEKESLQLARSTAGNLLTRSQKQRKAIEIVPTYYMSEGKLLAQKKKTESLVPKGFTAGCVEIVAEDLNPK